jgi:alcohol dehydrogenase (cytochrome c)
MRFALIVLAGSLLLAQTPRPGKQVFDTRCAMCHGDDANGGEFAPGILTSIATRTDSDIAAVVRDGLPNRGMPAVQLTHQSLTDLVAYLRTLRPPRRGELAAVPITIEMTDSRKLSGIAVNQSYEDMQLRTSDGRIHLLRREGSRFREVTSQVDWSSYDGQLSGNRFSTLKQIDKTNIAKLKPRWLFSLPDTPSLEVTPLVHEGIMYVTSGNECYALDAGTGRQIWHYHRQRTKGQGARVNRGAALSGDRVFMVTDDARLIALNRFTGELLWDTVMADYRQNYSATSAPLIAGDLVISGIAGGDGGVRGFLSAFNRETGKEVWRFWTIPAKGEPGSETWNGKHFAHPGGATWFTGSFDPDLNILYWQVGNPGPDHNGDEREGDNLYSDSVVALDVRSGKLKWHYQFTPHDVWDWDAQEPLVLVDSAWHGQPRKLMLQANRNGFFYVLDRTNGKLLLGKPFVKKLTWAKEIGPNGRPVRNPGAEPTDKGTKVCPAVLGATNWWSAAFDPSSSLYYVQTIESCGIYSKRDMEWEAGRGFMGGSSRNAPGDSPQRILRALDIKTGQIAWELPQVGSGESRSGTLATAAGIVFFGEDSGALMAADSTTGNPLWSFQTSQSLRASPMTYVFDNKQLVALASGSNILVFGLMD